MSIKEDEVKEEGKSSSSSSSNDRKQQYKDKNLEICFIHNQ